MFKSSFCTEFFAVTLHDRPVHILPPRFHGRNSSENRLLYRKPMPGHARTVSECARACQNHARSAPARAQGVPERARTMPARVSNDLWGSLYPSVDKLPQRSFNTGGLSFGTFHIEFVVVKLIFRKGIRLISFGFFISSCRIRNRVIDDRCWISLSSFGVP